MDGSRGQVFEFGAFVLATEERLLLRDGEPVPLRGKPFDLLVALVRRSGHLISKDELLRAVWPDTFVDEVNLSVNISAVRKALERGCGSGIIQTVPKRGYRFVPPDGAAAPRSIAVLPFSTDAPESSYLADGLTEATINGLARVRNVRVAPRAAALRYKTSRLTPAQVGQELAVAAIVTGSVSLQHGGLRIQADLVDVARDAQIWGARYEGDASELIHLQARILQDLARELQVPLSGQETAQLARPVTEHADAYRAYLQGRYAWNQRSEQSLRRAIGDFETAVDIDGRFAAAYSGLADSYSTLGYLSSIAPAEAFPVARRHALKALELDGSLPEPHASLGYVKLYFDWDWSGAETEFCRAIELDPNYAATHQWYSTYLLAAGRAKESLREIEIARTLDPLSLPVNTDLGFHYYYTRRYDDAVKQLKFVLNMKADFPPAHLWLGRSYQELGRFDDAIASFLQVEKKLPEWPVPMAARGFVEGSAGRVAKAQHTLAELKRLSGRKFVTSYGVALVHAGLGRNDRAFRWLDRAVDERSNWLVWLRLDPRWGGLRGDPRFSDLIDRMRFPPSGS